MVSSPDLTPAAPPFGSLASAPAPTVAAPIFNQSSIINNATSNSNPKRTQKGRTARAKQGPDTPHPQNKKGPNAYRKELARIDRRLKLIFAASTGRRLSDGDVSKLIDIEKQINRIIYAMGDASSIRPHIVTAMAQNMHGEIRMRIKRNRARRPAQPWKWEALLLQGRTERRGTDRRFLYATGGHVQITSGGLPGLGRR